MARVHPIQTNFTAGELSPELLGRPDLEKWGNGAAEITNAVVTLPGGVAKRGGTRFAGYVRQHLPCRLVPFVWSVDQAYVLEFTPGALRIWRNGGPVQNKDKAKTPVTLRTPYGNLSIIRQLSFAQSADVLWIAHRDFAPLQLRRKGDASWTLTTISNGIGEKKISGGPYLPLNADKALTIKPSGAKGIVTLTASAAVFTNAHVGSFLRLYTPRDAVGALTWERQSADSEVDKWANGTQVQYAGRTYEVTGGQAPKFPTDGATPPTHTEGVQKYYDANQKWIEYRYLHNGSAALLITAVMGARKAKARVINGAIPKETVDSGTPYWQEGAWNKRNGYPGCVGLHEQRLWFASSKAEPQTIWASKVGDYYDFTPGAEDDDAMAYTLASSDVDTIQWIMPGRVMAVGTTSGEYVLRASSQNEAITPKNITVRRESDFGSARVPPVRTASGVLFFERYGDPANLPRRLLHYGYDFEKDGYDGTPLTTLAEHILGNGASTLAVQRAPRPIVWTNRSNGTLVGLTLDRRQQVVAWHTHRIAGGGIVEATAVIPGGKGDDVWLVVRRGAKRFIEILQHGIDPQSPNDHWFLDSALSYVGAPKKIMGGLQHLNGETVAVVADGVRLTQRKVTAGTVTLDKPAREVLVGLPYTMRVVTLPVEAGAQAGTAQGRQKIAPEVTLRLYQSLGGKVGGLGTKPYSIFPALPSDLFTGDKKVAIDGGWTERGQLVIEHADPYPFHLLALLPTVQTTG